MTVNVDVAMPPDGGVTDVGENMHVEGSAGHPESVRLTAELKPFTDVTVTA